MVTIGLGQKCPFLGETKPYPTSKSCTETPERQRRRHGRGSARAPSGFDLSTAAGGHRWKAAERSSSPPGQKAQRRTHGGLFRHPAPFSTQKTERCSDSGAVGQVRHHGRGTPGLGRGIAQQSEFLQPRGHLLRGGNAHEAGGSHNLAETGQYQRASSPPTRRSRSVAQTPCLLPRSKRGYY